MYKYLYFYLRTSLGDCSYCSIALTFCTFFAG